jgi:hypothetical protein
MSRWLYRGTSLNDAREKELATGKKDGYTFSIHRGRLDMHDPQATVPAGTPLEEIEWWRPEGEDRGYLTDQQGVTGGFTSTLGSAVGFASGDVPLVFYFQSGGFNGTDMPVRYKYDFFDSFPGVAAWVEGVGRGTATGEVHAEEEGLMALTVGDEEGHPQLDRYWGHEDMRGLARRHEGESEVVVMDSEADVERAVQTVAIFLEGLHEPGRALASFDGYSAGYDEGEDVGRMGDEELLSNLHTEVRAASNIDIPDLWTVSVDTRVMDDVPNVAPGQVDIAYDGATVYEDGDAIPQHLLGM